jgi:hypothetical protein
VSRKTIAFSVPAARAAEVIANSARSRGNGVPDRPDAWVRERALIVPANPTELPAFAANPRPADPFVLDLAADRTLPEVFFLSLLTPWALGWFWLLRAMTAKPRF